MEEQQAESFIFYRSFFEAIREFPKDRRLEIYDAITNFAFVGEEAEFTGMQNAIFSLIKPLIEASMKNYKNGKKGGRPSNKPQQPPKENECSKEDIEDFISDYREIKNSDFEPTEREKMLIATTLSDIGQYKADYWQKVFKKSKAGFLIDGQKIPVSLRKILLEHNAIFRGEANLAPDLEEKKERELKKKNKEQKEKEEELKAVEKARTERENDKKQVNSAESAIDYLNKYLGDMPILAQQLSSDYKEFKNAFNISVSEERGFYEVQS